MKIMRKIMCLILAATMLLAAGCTVKREAALNEIKYVSANDPWYDVAIVNGDPDDIGCNISNSNVAMARDAYFITYSVGTDYDTWTQVNVLYKYDYDGNRLGRFDVVEAFNPEDREYTYCKFIKCFIYDDNEYYVVEVSVTDEETWQSETTYMVCTIDYDTNTCNVVDEKTFEGALEGNITLCDVAVSGDYVVYLLLSMNDYAFYVENMVDGTSYHAAVNLGNDYNFCSFDTFLCRQDIAFDGVIYYEVLRDRDAAYYSLDPATGAWQEVRNADFIDGIILPDGIVVHVDDLCVCCKNIITGDEIGTIYDSRNSAIAVACANIMDLVAYNGTNLILRYGLGGAGGIQVENFYIVKPSDTNPHVGKQIVTLGYSSLIDDSIVQLIINNNMNVDSEYYIEVVNTYDFSINWQEDYYTANTNANDKFINDVKSGHGPDIMIGGNRYAVANPGYVYVDLNEYLNSDDELSRDNLSDVVFDAYRVDGHVYNLPFGVTLNGLAVTASKFDQTGFTYEEYINHVNVHNYGNDALMTIPWSIDIPDKMYYFRRLFEQRFIDFIVDNQFNITEGEQGDQFRALIEFVNNKDSVYTNEGGESIILLNQSSSFFTNYISENEAKVRNYVGYPSYDGTATCFTNSDNTVSITTCCADKDAAWSIVKEFFSFETQIYTNTIIPVRMDALEYLCDDCINGISEQPDNYYIDWDTSLYDLNEYKEEFIYLIKNMKTAVYYDPMVMLIMNEELPAFFEGQKTADEVSTIVQNRVNNYMSEMYS